MDLLPAVPQSEENRIHAAAQGEEKSRPTDRPTKTKNNPGEVQMPTTIDEILKQAAQLPIVDGDCEKIYDLISAAYSLGLADAKRIMLGKLDELR
jgi:hypothetical protein